jgi:esterase
MFVPAAERIVAADARPTRWMLFLHGILGSGANFRTFARKLTQRRPDWGALLVDLRGHGRSEGAPPPHTVAAAADDLVHLEDDGGLDVQGVVGHSFGGKVALAYAERRARPLAEAWILDSSPGPRPPEPGPTSPAAVLGLLESIPQPLPSRQAFLDQVQPQLGRAVADWLAMSVRPVDHGYRLTFDLGAVRALLEDYARLDLWSVVEDASRARTIRFVVAGRSNAVPDADRRRLARSVRVHVLERAGHWLHVDDPDGLLALMTADAS